MAASSSPPPPAPDGCASGSSGSPPGPSLSVADVTLRPRPDRTLLWPDAGTLFAADVHLGKDAAFRARAVPLPHGSTRSDLDRLSAALTETGADRLVILGDLFHAAAGMTDATLDALEAWRDRHAGVEVVLVRGNHDRSAGPAPERLHITERKAPVASAPFVYRHEPGSSAGGFVLCGHLHPVVRLDGRGGERLRLRCFYRRRDRLVLPAFGEFTGGHVVALRTGEAAYAVADGEVVAVSP